MENQKLNIVILTGSNPFDNAGILASDMNKGLQLAGHNVLLLTRNHDKRLQANMKSTYSPLETYFNNLVYKMKFKLLEKRKTNSDYCMHSLSEIHNYIPTKKILKLLNFQPDLIIYLFSHRFLNARNLYELNRETKAPIAIIPVDMAQFTGGCHYSNGCERFKDECGKCPGLFSGSPKDITFKNLDYKKRYLAKTNLFTLSNTWTYEFLKQSSVFRDKHNFLLDIVIDEKKYCPGDPNESKRLLGIPENKQIIFFGATSVKEKRKGFSYLVEAINLLYQDLSGEEKARTGVAIAGKISQEITDLFPFMVYSLGHLSHEKLIHAYRMADVFVSPSLQDAGPMMVAQSMMCGTPVVAFEMGNAIDYIVNDQTGYRVELGNSRDLKEGILKILLKSPEERKKISEQCRELVMKKSSYKSFEENLFNNYIKYMNL